MLDREQAAGALHQADNISARWVVWGGVAIACSIIVAAIVSYFLWQWWDAPSGAQPLDGPNTGAVPTLAPPVLQSAPQLERAQYFAEKQRLLDSWKWIDRNAGTARIPIEEAMRIMAARSGAANAASAKEQQ